MRVLFLGPADSPILACLEERDAWGWRRRLDAVTATAEPLTVDRIASVDPDWTVCHGYRHILRGEVLRRLEGRAVNVHVSLLPWNRGADPNLWSFVDETPKGVSIHFVDEGVDTGDLIAQRFVFPDPADTLATSYRRLQDEALGLFRETWPWLRVGHCQRIPQHSPGSYHSAADRQRVEHLLTDGWDTPVASLTSVGDRV